MLRRHPILASLLALALLCTAALAIFLLTFDLDSYRGYLEQNLSRALAVPVQLGRASLSLRHGPAFEFDEVRIGEETEQDQSLQAEKLFLRLELRPLLQRQIHFSKILLQSPILRLTLPVRAAGKPAPADGKPRPPLWSAALVRTLEIEQGRVQLLVEKESGPPVALGIEELTGALDNLSLGHKGQIDLAGTLVQEGAGAPFTLGGRVKVPEQPADWRQALVDIQLEIRRLLPEPLLSALAPPPPQLKAAGAAELKLNLEGSPAEGLVLDAKLSGDQLSLTSPGLFRNALQLERIALQGTWQSDGPRERFSDLEMELNGLRLGGEVAAEKRAHSWWIEGTAEADLSLAQLVPLLPDADPRWVSARLKPLLAGGRLLLKQVRFAGDGETLLDPARQFGLQDATLRVSQATVRTAKMGPLDQLSLNARLQDRLLTLEKGKVRLLGENVDFFGYLDRPLQPEVQLALRAEGSLDAKKLLDLQGVQPRLPVQALGKVPVKVELSGPPQALTLDGTADLKGVEVEAGQWFNKPVGLEADLFVTGRITPERLELNHGRLRLPPLDARLRGALERQAPGAFELTVDLDRVALDNAHLRFPALERLKARGSLGLHYELRGAAGRLQQYRGTLFLRDLGLHLTRVLADLNRANGQIRLEEDRAVIEQLSARLGPSPLKISGSLVDYANPSIELRVKAPSLRADTLIFRSDQAHLLDVDGHLLIDREGIRFEPVRVRLEGGTRAVVTGSVTDFLAPTTRLDIRADYGNIDEVIGLWQGPEKAQPPPSGKPERPALHIKAFARHGHLGGLRFEQAEAEITLRDGVVVIYPLHFQSDQGYCVAQVAVARQDTGPSLLKISGHIENFSAGTIYSDLLKREGLVTGTLRGDFYLEGLAGKPFLASSSGGFNLDIRNGVLRKFKGLSKVFSLLNVSQILTLQLPDMALEGMPFGRLGASIALRKGVLSTEDLRIDSNAMNMSLVGSLDLNREYLDVQLGVKPLGTVDKIVTGIPLAGWLLAGEEKALLTAHFQIRGDSRNPEVMPMPINTVSEKVLGIFKRVLGLPGKVITDLGGMVEEKGPK